MLNREQYDKLLKLYGISSTDDKYNDYKKAQTSKAVSQQFNKLSSEMKEQIKKPSYPDLIIGPDEATGNKERMDYYNNQMKKYNQQQQSIKQGRAEVLKEIQQGFKDKMAYYNQQEKKAREEKSKTKPIPVKPPQVKPEKQPPASGGISNIMGGGKIGTSTKPSAPPAPAPPHKSQPINHNYMTFQQFKNFKFNSGFEVGQKEYLEYLKPYHVNNPVEHIQVESRVQQNKKGTSSLAQGKSIEEHNKEHSDNLSKHLDNNNIVVSKTPTKNPPQIVIHNFSKPTPVPHSGEHPVSSHSLNKQAKTEAGNPNNPPPKIVSGPRNDNHLNPSQQKTADFVAGAVTAGAQGGSASSIMGSATIGMNAATQGAQVGSKMETPTMDADGIMRFHNQGGVVGTSTI
tara:strand:+ start:1542 stop:2741 length:1200 start_codon:yes stop_codon:yes gene_type:complete